MKTKSRLLTLLLAALLLSPALSACGSTEPTDETAPADTTATDTTADTAAETELTDGLEDVDMNGFQMRFLHSTADGMNWVEVTLDADAESGDILSDAVFRRNEYVEGRFNAELVFYEEPNADISSKLYQQYVASGDDLYDIILLNGTQVVANIANIANLNNIPYVRFEKDWWNPTASALFYIDGKRLAVAGNYSLSAVSTANCLLFNKNMYDSLGFGDDIYDVVREGKWTIDTYFAKASAAQSDLNGDGKMDTADRWGTTGTVKSLHNMFIIGAGMNYVTRDADGYPVFQMASDEKLVSFMEKIVTTEIADPYIYHMPTNGIHSEDYPVKFDENQTLFFTAWPKNFFKIREMEEPFGVVPAPKFDEAQQKYYANMANGEFTTLPRSYREDRLENIGILLEAMSFYSQTELIPVYTDKVLDMKITRDYDSAEMLDIVYAGITYDFGVNGWAGTISDKIITDIFYAKSTAIVSKLVAIEPTITADVEKLKTDIKEVP